MCDELGATPEKSPWICHVCDYTSKTEESKTCSLCFRVTCSLHLQKVQVYNEQSGLYEPAEICIYCTPNE